MPAAAEEEIGQKETHVYETLVSSRLQSTNTEQSKRAENRKWGKVTKEVARRERSRVRGDTGGRNASVSKIGRGPRQGRGK